MSIVLWAQVAVFTHVMYYDVDWDMLGTMGRAPRTRETLPVFRESGRDTRHSLVFCRLMVVNGHPGSGASHIFSINKSFFFWQEAFSSLAFFPLLLLSPLFSQFLGSQTPSEDDNSEDEWLETLSP